MAIFEHQTSRLNPYLREHPIASDLPDLSGHRLVALGAKLSAMPAAPLLDVHAGTASVVLRTNEMVTMLEAAVSGAGLALLVPPWGQWAVTLHVGAFRTSVGRSI